MKKYEKVPGQFVTSVTVSELLISTGIQLIHWANDLAFTDAAFGEAWSVEAANRMATLSELLNIVYKRLPRRSLEIVIDMPKGVIGMISINPDYNPDSAKPFEEGKGDAAGTWGDTSSIDENPF